MSIMYREILVQSVASGGESGRVELRERKGGGCRGGEWPNGERGYHTEYSVVRVEYRERSIRHVSLFHYYWVEISIVSKLAALDAASTQSNPCRSIGRLLSPVGRSLASIACGAAPLLLACQTGPASMNPCNPSHTCSVPSERGGEADQASVGEEFTAQLEFQY